MSIESPETILVEYVAGAIRPLVDNPNGTRCRLSSDELLLIATTDPKDRGQIIGKHGVIAHALRTLLRAACGKHAFHVDLFIPDSDILADPAPRPKAPRHERVRVDNTEIAKYVQHLVGCVVDHPETLLVTITTTETVLIVDLLPSHAKQAAQLVGKAGRIISALRVIVAAYAAKHGFKCSLVNATDAHVDGAPKKAVAA